MSFHVPKDKWTPQPEIEREICIEPPCQIETYWPAVRFVLHAPILPEELLKESPDPQHVQFFEQIRNKRIRDFVIQMGAIAQMMELDENELTSALWFMQCRAAQSFEKRFFDGIFDNQKWRQP